MPKITTIEDILVFLRFQGSILATKERFCKLIGLKNSLQNNKKDNFFKEIDDKMHIDTGSMPIIRQASGTQLAAYCEAGVGQ